MQTRIFKERLNRALQDPKFHDVNTPTQELCERYLLSATTIRKYRVLHGVPRPRYVRLKPTTGYLAEISRKLESWERVGGEFIDELVRKRRIRDRHI